MPGRIHELLKRNLDEVFGEGDAARRRVAIEDLYTDDCVVEAPPGVFVGRDALIGSLATCVRLTLSSYTRLTASRRRSITPAVWRGVRVRAGRSRTIPDWT
jgi:hypothetical protein